MPWGWECRAKLVKQVPAKPTSRRGVSNVRAIPAPNNYELPQLLGGSGVNKIRRAPAYTFGLKTKSMLKPSTTKNARLFNIQGMINKGGSTRVTHGLVTPHIEPVVAHMKCPGPAAYAMPKDKDSRRKRAPAYSLRPPYKPDYKPSDMWTPPPNMYCPPVALKKEPAYSLGYPVRILKRAETPGPGEHDPNFGYVIRNRPAYSFGAPYRRLKPMKSPAPNTYCEKKFMVTLRCNPAPSFGIRHSPYIGEKQAYLKSSKEDMAMKNN